MMSTTTLMKACTLRVTTESTRIAPVSAMTCRAAATRHPRPQRQRVALCSRSLSAAQPLVAEDNRLYRPAAHTKRVIKCGWGDPVEWSKVKVASKSTAAESLLNVTLEVGKEAVSAYAVPGQYVQMRTGGDDSQVAYIAIANPPGSTSSTLEFLIKPVEGAAAGDVCALDVGAEMEMSPIQGKGFPMGKAADAKTVLLFATGSGISPVKALIEADANKGGLNASARKDVRLYYGAASEATMAFSDKFAEWESKGVTVVPVFSQAGDKQYVQDAFKADARGIGSEASEVACVLVGQKEMSIAITEMMEAAGVTKEQLLSNF